MSVRWLDRIMDHAEEAINAAIKHGLKFPLSVPFTRPFGASMETVREIEEGMMARGYNCTIYQTSATAIWMTVTRV